MIYAVFGDLSEGVECGLGCGGWNWGARGDVAVVMAKVKWGRVVERFFVVDRR